MDPRVSFITLVVSDLAATRRFYVEGLGWEPEVEVEGDVVMVRVADKLVLSFWAEPGFEQEVGPVGRGSGLVPLTLSQNQADRAAVDRVLADARAAGASEVGDAEDRPWGGYSGYFADPDGFRWEIAWNPQEIGMSVL